MLSILTNNDAVRAVAKRHVAWDGRIRKRVRSVLRDGSGVCVLFENGTWWSGLNYVFLAYPGYRWCHKLFVTRAVKLGILSREDANDHLECIAELEDQKESKREITLMRNTARKYGFIVTRKKGK